MTRFILLFRQRIHGFERVLRRHRATHRTIAAILVVYAILLLLYLLEDLPRIPEIGTIWWFVPLLAAFPMYLLFRARIVPDQQVCSELDRLIDGRQVVSAAGEILEGDKSGPLSDLVMRRAVAKTEIIPDPPWKFSRFERWGGIIPILALVFALFDMSFPAHINAAYAEQGRILEEYAETMAERAQDDNRESTLRLAEELGALGRRMQRENLDEEQLREMLNDALDAVERERRFLNRRSEGGMSPDSNLSSSIEDALARLAQDPESSQELLDKLQNMLQEKEGPSQKDLEDLTQSLGVQERVDRQSAQDIQKKLKELTDEDSSDEEEDLDSAENKLVDVAEKTFLSKGEDNAGQGDQAPAEGDTPTPVIRGGDEVPDENTDTEGMQPGTVPGLDAPKEDSISTNQPPQESEESVGAELDGLVTRQGDIQTMSRNMPGEGESVLEDQDIVGVYSRQAEEAIRSENIPSRARELVKDYFLKIGVVQEEGE